METSLSVWAGLAAVQVLFYRMKLKDGLRHFWFFWVFYYSIFMLVRGVYWFCDFASLSFYELPFLAIMLFVGSRLTRDFLPRFRKTIGGVPDFYLLSSLWAGFGWRCVYGSDDLSSLGGSLIAAVLLLIVLGIKDRLELIKAPHWCWKPALFWLSIGLILLGLIGFKGLGNWQF